MKVGKMLREVLGSFLKKPATNLYPKENLKLPEGYRGRIIFFADKCIGCQMCMRDCPSGAIAVNKNAENKFEAVIDLGKCLYCGQCVDSCLKKALEVTSQVELGQLQREKLRNKSGDS
jgi:formate hydrogenlyase subunit 6/NADH:ubiquinone oxidoreductase subunit I